MSNRKHTRRSFGKGYYIALILCAVAIGISGYLYYRNANHDPQLGQPPANVQDGGEDVQAVATQPGQTDATQPSQSDTPQPGKKPMKIVRPVSGETVGEYAMDCLSYNPTTRDWRTHNGIDIAAEAGTEVCAAADGTVYTTYDDDTMGMTVVIRHENGYVTRYASLDAELSVAAGDKVTAGQTIGKVANTALMETAVGNHLHFAVTCNDESVDPEEFFSLS